MNNNNNKYLFTLLRIVGSKKSIIFKNGLISKNNPTFNIFLYAILLEGRKSRRFLKN